MILRAPVTNGMLYDSMVDSVALMVYDSKKRFFGYRDTFCKPIKLEKGDFVALFQICHEDVDILEKCRHMPIMLDVTLAKPIAVDFHLNANAALLQSTKMKPVQLQKGERAAIFCTSSFEDKLPKDSAPGHILLGTIKYGKKSETLTEDGTLGGQVMAYVTPKKNQKDSSFSGKETSSSGEKKSQAEQVC